MNPLLQKEKDEVAQKDGFNNWEQLWFSGYSITEPIINNVCELYAKYSREEEIAKFKKDCIAKMECLADYLDMCQGCNMKHSDVIKEAYEWIEEQKNS